MFPRSKRLTRSDFSGSGVLRGGRRSTAHLSALFPSERKGYAVIISKKTVQSSVKRHLLKRRILSVLTKLPGLPSALVVYPRASALALPFKELASEVACLVSGTTHSR